VSSEIDGGVAACPAHHYRERQSDDDPLPCELRSAKASGHVLVAWDGSAAMVSVLEAFLSRVGNGTTLTLAEMGRRSGPSATDAAAWLADRGVAVRVHSQGPGEPAPKALYSACCATRPDYCLISAASCR
jgi:hypothetical protein